MSTSVNIHEAKTHLSRLLERVEAGETIIIARAGRPIAELKPLQHGPVRVGGLRGAFGDYQAAFGPEADAEVLGMFDSDLGLDASS